MRQIIEKLVQDLLLSPLSWALWCFLASWILLQKNRAKAAKSWLTAGVTLLLLFSSSLVADFLGLRLEREHQTRPFSAYPNAQAIVLLGGSASGILSPRLAVEEINGARVLGAARLFKAKKAPLILVSGGGSYVGPAGEARNQATDLRDLLVEYGVPREAIVMEEQANNTLENALLSQKILGGRGVKEILLVTSAYHVGRASKLYEKAGFRVTAVPTSHEHVETFQFGVVPKASNLERSARYLKEYFGRAIGR